MQLDKRMPLPLFAALVILFCGPALVAAADAPAKNRLPHRASAKAGGAQQNHGPDGRSASKPAQRLSPFVQLGQRIVADAYVFNTSTDLGLNAFAPDIADRVFATADIQWAFGPIERAPQAWPSLSAAASPAATTITVRPLDFDGAPSHPFFGDPFKSVAGVHRPTENNDTALFDGDTFGNTPGLPSGDGTPAAGKKTSGTASSRSPLAYRYAMDKATTVNAGVHWIQDLGDATGMAPSLDEPGGDGSAANRLPGVNMNLGASFGALTLTGGYIRALDSRTSTELAMAGKESDPVAWSSELAYSTELLRREATLAVGYQRASEALHTYLPEERYRTKASMALSDSTVFSLEYYLDREDMTRNGATDGYGITTKIGFGF